MKKDLLIEHNYIMNQIENSKSLVDIPNGLTQSKVQTCLSKYSKFFFGNRIPAKEFNKISTLLIVGVPFDSEVIQSLLEKICNNHFDENAKVAQTYLTETFKNSEELKNVIEEVKAATFKRQEIINSEINKESILYIVPNRPKKTGGEFHTCYVSKNVNLDLEAIVVGEIGLEYLSMNGTIYSEEVDALEDLIRIKYDDSFRRIGGIILHKYETLGVVNTYGPKKENVVETQISEMEEAISNMTLVRDGLSTEIHKLEKTLAKIKK